MSGEPPRWQQPRARHLNADDLDPPRSNPIADGILIAFAILVLVYFAAQMLRAAL